MKYSPITLLLCVLVFLLTACSAPNTNQADERPERKVSYVDMNTSEPTAVLLIEGMTCERMCVNAVKKSVSQVPGVQISALHFDADIAVDTLVLQFDPSKAGQAELLKAIEDLAGGSTYFVKEIQLSQDAKTSCRPAPQEGNRGLGRKKRAKAPFTVPNPFEVLRKVSL